MATLKEARAARAEAERMYPGASVGLCGTGPGNYAVKVGVPGGTALQDAPGDIDGVPVRFEVQPPARKLTAEEFRQLGPARMLEWPELKAGAAALEDGERMRRMIEAMAEKYETTGHPCCPLCDGTGDSPADAHEDGCDFGLFLKERRDKFEQGVKCQDR